MRNYGMVTPTKVSKTLIERHFLEITPGKKRSAAQVYQGNGRQTEGRKPEEMLGEEIHLPICIYSSVYLPTLKEDLSFIFVSQNLTGPLSKSSFHD